MPESLKALLWNAFVIGGLGVVIMVVIGVVLIVGVSFKLRQWKL